MSRTKTVYCLALFYVLLSSIAGIAQDISIHYRQLDSLNAIKKSSQYGSQRGKSAFTTGEANTQLRARTPVPLLQPPRQSANRPFNTNTVCEVRSARNFLTSDSLTFYSDHPTPTADGNLLVGGQYVTHSTPQTYGGMLMKSDYEGNVIWTKLYDSTNHAVYHSTHYYYVYEQDDGTIILGGATTNRVTGNDDLIITKTDNNGNPIWTKIFRSRLWTNGDGSADYFYIQDLKKDPYTGDIFLCGPHWANGKALIRINQNTGNIVWSNYYDIGSNGAAFDNAFGIDITATEILYFGRYLAGSTVVMTIYRVDKTSGNVLQTKFFTVNDPAGVNTSILNCDKLQKLDNGNYRVGGSCYGYTTFPPNPAAQLYQGAVVEFNSNLDFVEAFAFRNDVPGNSYNTTVTLHPDGSGFFNMLEIMGGWTGNLFQVQIQDNQIVKQRKRFFTDEGMPFQPFSIPTPDKGDLIVQLLGHSTDYHLNRIGFTKLHPSDTSSECLGIDDTRTWLYYHQYVPTNSIVSSTGYNDFSESQVKTLTTSEHSFTRTPGCIQTSFCDTLKLLVSADSICAGNSITIIARKNEECGIVPLLQYDPTAVSSAVQVNDSTYTLTFDDNWRGYIYGKIPGCTLLKDSVLITVLRAPLSLDLGPDTTICPSNTIILNAHAGYASYTWNDGSTDSLFTITQPGTYYVDTRTACGQLFTDTVHVAARTSPPVSIGADRSKCNADTLHLHATTGFLNYSWSPDYEASNINSPTIIVAPAIDTSYMVKAESSPGCFSFDTIRVRVFHSPPIDLGADFSLCTGDSMLLNAGNGFTHYSWSNGSSASQTYVHTQGQVTVDAVTADGCHSRDTVRVISLYSLPVITLNDDPALCTGTSRILNAGNGFNSYAWNTGASTQQITVNAIGMYAVMVTDQQGCRTTDTVRIEQILPSPAGFLPPDTAICNYGSIQLKAAGNFSRYNWNTNSTSSSINITQPGIYWLDATDAKGCVGRDSVTVNPKECLTGFYIPGAFTPNNDGRNDTFYPLVFGNIRSYRFTIYNRWGEIVFSSTTPGHGWNGRLQGVQQDNHVFAWTCEYQLQGEPVQLKKGTVVLVR